jgi:hypothetical protein
MKILNTCAKGVRCFPCPCWKESQVEETVRRILGRFLQRSCHIVAIISKLSLYLHPTIGNQPTKG